MADAGAVGIPVRMVACGQRG